MSYTQQEIITFNSLQSIFIKCNPPQFKDNNWITDFNGDGFDFTLTKIINALDIKLNLTPDIFIDNKYFRKENDTREHYDIIGGNEKYKNYILYDVYKVEYKNLYLNIMKSIKSDKQHKMSVDMNKLITELIKFRSYIKMKESCSNDIIFTDLYHNINFNIKAFINYIYGKCNNSNVLQFNFSVNNYIRRNVETIWNMMKLCFKDYLIYYDTDIMYLLSDTPSNKLSAIDLSGFEYDIARIPAFAFNRLKMIYTFNMKIPSFKINGKTLVPYTSRYEDAAQSLNNQEFYKTVKLGDIKKLL